MALKKTAKAVFARRRIRPRHGNRNVAVITEFADSEKYVTPKVALFPEPDLR